jgi:multidrug efflux pump
VQDLSAGGRQTSAAYQYTLQGDDSDELYAWTSKLTDALQHDNRLVDVNSDQQQSGLETNLIIDRDIAARLGVTPLQIDSTLYDAFGQRQVSVIYGAQNQYHVVMEVAPRYWQDPETLKQIWVSTSGAPASGTQTTNALPGTVSGSSGSKSTAFNLTSASAQSARNAANNGIASVGHGVASSGAAVSTMKESMVPLAAVTSSERVNTPITVNHQGAFVATTISFNLPPGRSLSDAVQAVADASRRIGLPATIHGEFVGTAQVFRQSLASEPLLILAALVAMYIVLGVLYESFIHPVTILSSLPSAGVGALLALLAFHTEFSIIALIGVILLIGIIKKNAIMMIDFAIVARRDRGLSPRDAIATACRLRFRPIMMTTTAALLGALPLILSFGEGSELRRPLGISIVGGLIVSQALTLYTTPVVYLYLDRFSFWASQRWRRVMPRPAGATEAAE